jgi:hypothetical protein
MILNKTVTACDGEVSVKSYLCTSFSSMLFGIKADGYLEVTNKRLLFQAAGMGATKHKSVIHSEVPISEVVGVNIYKGKGFNLLRFIGGLILTLFIVIIVAAIITPLLSFLNDSPTTYQFIIWALFAGVLYFAYVNRDTRENDDSIIQSNIKDNSFKELALVAVGLGFLLTLARESIGLYSQFGSGKFAIPVFLIVLLFALYRFSKKSAFSLFIHSKSSSNAIVRISGPSPMGAASSAASKALTAKPGVDSLLVLQELGAVILDLQNMGEYGIEKWKK